MEQELIDMWAQVGVGVGQLLLIAWGLQRMSEASAERNRQLDQQSEVPGQIGQALERQSQALERQGQVLAELLQRGA